jgi:hypothetical protein
MQLAFSVNSAGYVAGSFSGDLNAEIFWTTVHFGYISLDYVSTRSPYQFQGIFDVGVMDFTVYYGSGGARICKDTLLGTVCWP